MRLKLKYLNRLSHFWFDIWLNSKWIVQEDISTFGKFNYYAKAVDITYIPVFIWFKGIAKERNSRNSSGSWEINEK